jgi:hypothetical protein
VAPPPPVYYSPSAPVASPYAGAPEASRRAADAGGGSHDKALAESASANVQRQQLGTGHGERRYDPVAQTRFERDSRWPNQRIALYYDSWQALAARGVTRSGPYGGDPDPFPLGFVPDPN